MKALCLVALAGCFALGETGYTNTLAPHGAGGGSLVLRAGPDTLGDPYHHSLIDLAVRADLATSGSRGAVGTSVAYVPWNTRANSLVVRGELWLDPLRGGAADGDAFALPAAEVGWLWYPEATEDLYSLGARAEWLGRPGSNEGSVGYFIYVGIGTRIPLTIPR